MGFLRFIFITGGFLLGISAFGNVNAVQCKGDPKNNTPFTADEMKNCLSESIDYFNALPAVVKKKLISNFQDNNIPAMKTWKSPAILAQPEVAKYIQDVKEAGDESIEKYNIDLKYYVKKKEDENKRLNSNSRIGPNRWVSPRYNKEIKTICRKLRDLGESLPPGCVVMLKRRDIR